MKMCLAPCYKGCTDERYGEEAAAVERFLATRGESRLVTLRTERDEASARLEFEAAAAIHAQVQRVESVRALAPELVRPMSQLRAVVLQASAVAGEVAVFLYENGRLAGPVGYSTLGMRIQNEQSGSSSLFAHPMAIEAIPEEEAAGPGGEDSAGAKAQVDLEASAAPFDKLRAGLKSCPDASGASGSSDCEAPAASEAVQPKLARGILEARMEEALAALAEGAEAPSQTLRQGHLALLKRWYYRPEIRRTGEIFFPDAEGRWPVKAMLRGVGRVAAKMMVGGDRD
jgi:hypothetical protein